MHTEFSINLFSYWPLMLCAAIFILSLPIGIVAYYWRGKWFLPIAFLTTWILPALIIYIISDLNVEDGAAKADAMLSILWLYTSWLPCLAISLFWKCIFSQKK